MGALSTKMPTPRPLSRLPIIATLMFVVSYFCLVAVFLGPNIVEHRDKNVLWYVLHIGGGSLVLVLGPFQFIAALRNRFRRYHRIAGYTFVFGSFAAVLGYIGMPKTELFLTSQLVALALWSLCASFAVVAARSRKMLAHQHNMARSFVLACYFLTARLFDRYGMGLLSPLASTEPVKLAHSDWLAWVLPLLLVEVYFAYKWQAVLRSGKRSPGAV